MTNVNTNNTNTNNVTPAQTPAQAPAQTPVAAPAQTPVSTISLQKEGDKPNVNTVNTNAVNTAAPAQAKVGMLAKTWNATKDGLKGSYKAVKTAAHAGHLQGQVYILQVMDKLDKVKFLEISDDAKGLKAKAERYAKLGLKWIIIGISAVPAYLAGFCVGLTQGFSAALKGEQEKSDIVAKLKADKDAFKVSSSEDSKDSKDSEDTVVEASKDTVVEASKDPVVEAK